MAPITEKAVMEQVIAWCTALILEINRLLVALPVHQDNIPPQTPQDLVDPFTPVPEIGNYTLDNLNAFLLRVPATTVAPSTQTAASGGITVNTCCFKSTNLD
jgi:hypothetical protein